MSTHLIKYFEYGHLPPALQEVARPLCELAWHMEELLPDSAEKTTGLRRLLEAKDCLVRARLDQMEEEK